MRPLDADGPAHRPREPELPSGPPPLVLPALEAQRLACCLRDAATELARDGRADPLPIARLLAQAAEIVGMACPTCGGSGETGAYVGLGPGPRPDDVPERCPACEEVQHVAR